MKHAFLFTIGLLVSAMILPTSTSAQDDIRFGAIGGLNFAKASFSKVGSFGAPSLKMKMGIHLGVFGEKEIQENLSVQAGLVFSSKGYRNSGDDFKNKVSLAYLEIPVNAVYRFDKLFVGAGPYIAYGISGKAKYEETLSGIGGLEPGFEDDFEESTSTDKLKMGGKNGDLKALDLGFNILAGYQITDQIAVNANYGLGLANINVTKPAMKNRVFSLSVRYMLDQIHLNK